MIRRIVALLLAALLPAALAVSTAAAGAEPFSDSPRLAYIASPISASAGICEISDDYEMPQAVYWNGQPVLVHAQEKSRGGYPEALDDPTETWAFVTIGESRVEGSIYGWIPLAALSQEKPANASVLPRGILQGEGGIALYGDNGLTDEVLEILPVDTEVEILGQMKRFFHVRTGGKEGFVKPGNLIVQEADIALFDRGQPLAGFADTMPGHAERYKEYSDKLMQLYSLYQDVSEFPLAARAEASELALRYGFEYMSIINSVPGKDDLPEEKALELGLEAIKKEYGWPEDAIQHSSIYFYYLPEDPETFYWDISAFPGPGYTNSTVTLNRKGGVEGFRQAVAPNTQGEESPGLSPLELKRARMYIDYYLQDGMAAAAPEGAIPTEAALDMAWEAFTALYPGENRADYALNAAYRQSRQYGLGWWLVDITKPADDYHPYFLAAVMSDGGKTVTTTREDYDAQLESLAWYESYLKLVAERGPQHKWTLEEKAAFEPDYYGLPTERDITLEEALDFAETFMLEHFLVPQEDFLKLQAYPWYMVEGVWRIDYLEKGLPDDALTSPYVIYIDSETGDVLDAWDARMPSNG